MLRLLCYDCCIVNESPAIRAQSRASSPWTVSSVLGCMFTNIVSDMANISPRHACEPGHADSDFVCPDVLGTGCLPTAQCCLCSCACTAPLAPLSCPALLHRTFLCIPAHKSITLQFFFVKGLQYRGSPERCVRIKSIANQWHQADIADIVSWSAHVARCTRFTCLDVVPLVFPHKGLERIDVLGLQRCHVSNHLQHIYGKDVNQAKLYHSAAHHFYSSRAK